MPEKGPDLNRDGTGDLQADLNRVADKARELADLIKNSPFGQDVAKVKAKIKELGDDILEWLEANADDAEGPDRPHKGD